MLKHVNYFPGANSYLGFYSFFDNIINLQTAKKVYIIKGGPGTGKSTFMKRIGDRLIEKGIFTEYFYCSSDFESLDGICASDFGVAFIDGTAPHIIDPVYPGAVEEILNLGEFFDTDKLSRLKVDIISLNTQINNYFNLAYSHLNSIFSLKKVINEIEDNFISDGYINKICEGICQQIFGYAKVSYRRGKGRKLFLSAITPQGLKSFIREYAKKYYNIFIIHTEFDKWSQGLLHIMEYALERGFDVESFWCGYNPNKLEHLAIPELSTFIITSNKYHEITDDNYNNIRISMDKQINGYDKEIYNWLLKQIENGIDNAISYLKKAKELHDQLEKFYVASMDFERIDQRFEQIWEEVQDYLV